MLALCWAAGPKPLDLFWALNVFGLKGYSFLVSNELQLKWASDIVSLISATLIHRPNTNILNVIVSIFQLPIFKYRFNNLIIKLKKFEL